MTDILEEMQTPLHKRYHVVCEDENEFWLVYDPALTVGRSLPLAGPATEQHKEY